MIGAMRGQLGGETWRGVAAVWRTATLLSSSNQAPALRICAVLHQLSLAQPLEQEAGFRCRFNPGLENLINGQLGNWGIGIVQKARYRSRFWMEGQSERQAELHQVASKARG